MKAIIFDMDGTLLESMSMWDKLIEEYLTVNGIPFTPPVNIYEPAMKQNDCIDKMREQYGVTMTLQEFKLELTNLSEKRYRTDIQMKPYVREFLERCRREGIPMCVATATRSEHARMCLERLDAMKYFSTLISTADTKINKYNPDVYFRCAEHMGVKPEETAVFEDALYAAKTAAAAGFRVVGVYEGSTYWEFPEFTKTADITIHSFKELTGDNFSRLTRL